MRTLQPACYGCARKAAPGRMFCGVRCAAEYAERCARDTRQQWCPVCARWRGWAGPSLELACGHVATGMTEGMRLPDALAHYKSAITGAMTQAIASPQSHTHA